MRGVGREPGLHDAGDGLLARLPFLNPGGLPHLREHVPVNIVFVGYTHAQVNRTAFLNDLPDSYQPVVRDLLYYGIDPRLGINYTYDYNAVFTNKPYEDKLFGALKKMSTPAPNTIYQDLYNSQKHNVVDVADNNFISAPDTEHWLAHHAPAGVNTKQDTVYLIDWWGRPDFEFHVYTKFDEPDPDTGAPQGERYSSRKVVAWGGTPGDDPESGDGTTHRVWFFDHSAGPDAWAGGYDLDDKDLDGDYVADYRIPAVWEYAKNGYRSPSKLTGDLALLTRYVALDTLFTTSPVFKPDLTPPGMPGTINLDLNTYEAWPGVDASKDLLQKNLVVQNEAKLLRLPVSGSTRDLALTGKAAQCLDGWVNGFLCYPKRTFYPDPFANLFLYHALNHAKFVTDTADYDAMVFAYSTENDIGGGLLGYTDDNWFDGTQSSVFSFVSKDIVESFGYGQTTTDIHELGHLFGMSHPHDGWDSETGQDFGPEGDFYFAWMGDESNSIMSYLDLNDEFSQFDYDNHWRTTAGAYLVNANAIAADVVSSPGAAAGMASLRVADVQTGLTEAAFAAHRYAAAFEHARRAFDAARAAAAAAGVPVVSSTNGWYVVPADATARVAQASRVARIHARIPDYMAHDELDAHRLLP